MDFVTVALLLYISKTDVKQNVLALKCIPDVPKYSRKNRKWLEHATIFMQLHNFAFDGR